MISRNSHGIPYYSMSHAQIPFSRFEGTRLTPKSEVETKKKHTFRGIPYYCMVQICCRPFNRHTPASTSSLSSSSSRREAAVLVVVGLVLGTGQGHSHRHTQEAKAFNVLR